ncbi:MAG: PadR family transcriptional regulator [Gemmatimonadota bacterium]|nr:PadR family transcriptional regulator [Gemmatimonadota bacterium]
MARPGIELLQGTLDVMILKTLSWKPMHGYGIAKWIQQITDDVLQIDEGSLYPALYRMEKRAWVTAEWGITENNRRAKYYRLTAAGRRHFAAEASSWAVFAQAVGKILRATRQPV